MAQSETNDKASTYEPVLTDFTIGNALGPGWSTESRGPGWKASLFIAAVILLAVAAFFATLHFWR